GRLTQDGFLQEFQPGTAMLAMRAGVPVLPAAMYGTADILPYGEVKPRRTGRSLRIRFGPPIDLSTLPGGDRHETLTRATELIREGVAKLMEEIAPETIHSE